MRIISESILESRSFLKVKLQLRNKMKLKARVALTKKSNNKLQFGDGIISERAPSRMNFDKYFLRQSAGIHAFPMRTHACVSSIIILFIFYLLAESIKEFHLQKTRQSERYIKLGSEQ